MPNVISSVQHHMLREIFEQPVAIRDALRGRVEAKRGVVLEHEVGPAEIFKSMERVVIVGCGTSRHAGLIGKSFIESFARIPVDVDYASEFRRRDSVFGTDTLVVAVTQSGETADTVGAMHKARDQSAFVLSICNVPGSRAARMADAVLFTHSGPEVGLASTKTFASQLVSFYLLALFLGQVRGAVKREEVLNRLRLLNRVPEQAERVLDCSTAVEALAARFCDYPHALYLGRGINFPVALEGAVKLKKLSLIHADAYPSAEVTKGAIAFVDSTAPIVVIAPRDPVYPEIVNNLDSLKVREGLILAIATETDPDIGEKADYIVRIPEADPFLNPFLTVIPLQLFAYHAAALRGLNTDRLSLNASAVMVDGLDRLAATVCKPPALR